MKTLAPIERAESPRPTSDCMAPPARIAEFAFTECSLPAGTADVAEQSGGVEPPPLDWQSLIVGSAFVLACLGVLASLVR